MHNPDDNIQSVMEVQAVDFANYHNLNLDKKFLFSKWKYFVHFYSRRKKEHHEQSVLTMTTTRSQKFHRTNKQTNKTRLEKMQLLKLLARKKGSGKLGVNFTNILRAGFAPIFLSQKSTILKCKYKKLRAKCWWNCLQSDNYYHWIFFCWCWCFKFLLLLICCEINMFLSVCK